MAPVGQSITRTIDAFIHKIDILKIGRRKIGRKMEG